MWIEIGDRKTALNVAINFALIYCCHVYHPWWYFVRLVLITCPIGQSDGATKTRCAARSGCSRAYVCIIAISIASPLRPVLMRTVIASGLYTTNRMETNQIVAYTVQQHLPLRPYDTNDQIYVAQRSILFNWLQFMLSSSLQISQIEIYWPQQSSARQRPPSQCLLQGVGRARAIPMAFTAFRSLCK